MSSETCEAEYTHPESAPQDPKASKVFFVGGKPEAAKTQAGGNSPSDKLRELIQERIKEQPFACDGYTWAAAPQSWWCNQLGVSIATLQRLIARPPFVRKRVHIDGRVVTLLRVGASGDQKGPEDYVRIMAAMWRRKTGRRPRPHDYGCIRGLIETWPAGKAPELLGIVLADWSKFMSGAKNEMEEDRLRYYEFPSLKVVRRFPNVALEMKLMQVQEAIGKGKGPK